MKNFLVILIVVITGLTVACASKEKMLPVSYTDKTADPKKIWTDAELKNRFSRYWTYRSTSDLAVLKDMYQIEAPYIQEMVDEKKYQVYMKGPEQNRLVEVRIRGIVAKTKYLYEVDCVLWIQPPKGEKQQVFIKDEWVKVQKNWYHLFRDPIFFPAI